MENLGYRRYLKIGRDHTVNHSQKVEEGADLGGRKVETQFKGLPLSPPIPGVESKDNKACPKED